MKEENSVMGLAVIRRNRGISLEQISASTKISVRLLEAIERGDYRKLPGGIYNAGYLRQYARAIDYDEAALLEFYYRQMAGESTPAANSDSKRIFTGFGRHPELPDRNFAA